MVRANGLAANKLAAVCGFYGRSRADGPASRTPHCFGGRVVRRRLGVRRKICAGYSFTLNARALPWRGPRQSFNRASVAQFIPSIQPPMGRWTPRRLAALRLLRGRRCAPGPKALHSARFAIIHGHSCPRRQQFLQRWSRALFARLTWSNERSPRSPPRNRSPLRPSNCGPLAKHALLH